MLSFPLAVVLPLVPQWGGYTSDKGHLTVEIIHLTRDISPLTLCYHHDIRRLDSLGNMVGGCWGDIASVLLSGAPIPRGGEFSDWWDGECLIALGSCFSVLVTLLLVGSFWGWAYPLALMAISPG